MNTQNKKFIIKFSQQSQTVLWWSALGREGRGICNGKGLYVQMEGDSLETDRNVAD